jgi:hypothetical protein
MPDLHARFVMSHALRADCPLVTDSFRFVYCRMLAGRRAAVAGTPRNSFNRRTIIPG